MSDDKEDPTSMARRSLLGAASFAPVVPPSPTDLHVPKQVVALCAAWIALDVEIDRLSVRWSQVETLMAREFQWFSLTPAERRALPEAAEMYEIDAKLAGLSYERERQLDPLSRLKADTLHGVASKLAVAARLLQHGDGPTHALVAGAVRELADLHCSGCGAAYVVSDVARPR